MNNDNVNSSVKQWWKLILIVLIMGLAIGFAQDIRALAAPVTTTYHVALTGDDSNDGSAGAPFRTITQGASVLQAGDTLIIHDGDYGSEFDIAIPNNGTATAPITIKAENRGAVKLHGSRQQGNCI